MKTDNFILKKENCLLLVIDIQEKLFNAMKPDVGKTVEKNAVILFETAKTFKIPVLITEQYRKGLGDTIPAILDRTEGEEPIEKTHFNCMCDNNIADEITKSGRKTIIIMGMEAHVCVLFTAITLLTHGFNVVIAGDAVCSRRKQDWQMTLNALTSAGAVVYPTESISFMLINQSGTHEFRKLSKMFK
jgi:nicotinamidase-related amidase